MSTGFSKPATLEAFVLEKMVTTRLPGLAFALIEEGQVVHQRGMGFTNLDRRNPPTEKTMFGIGSVTKVFTALAVMQLREQGKLDLEDPVGDHLGIPLLARDEPIRIRHFLSHSSGIPALGFSESKMSRRWHTEGYPIGSTADLLTFMAGSESWIHSEPGKRWAYLNEGYVLLGAIIEAASGVPYTQYIKQALLEPLGMKRSHFERKIVEQDENRVTPYMRDRDNKLFVGSNLYSDIPAAGGLVSTVEDLSKLTLALLNDGITEDGVQIIESESLALMQTPAVEMTASETNLFPNHRGSCSIERFGLGLYLQEDFLGINVAGHGGGVMGSTGHIAFAPKEGLGVVLQTNGHGYPMRQLTLAAIAHGLGLDFEDLPFIKLDRLLQRLTGSYRSFRDTMEAEVRRRGDNLELSIWMFNEDRKVWLIPESVTEDHALFTTFSSGRSSPVEFIFSNERVDLLYERYAFRKTN